MDILERFLKYVAIDTTSNPLKEENPSSENQKDLAEILVKELTDLGIEVYYDNKHCYVYAKMSGNSNLPSIGFVSHLDTSSNACGKDVKPRLTRNNDEHGDILVCFTPDEEIGLGVKNLNTNYFNPDFAYTVDGIDLGEFSYENFNAGSAQVKIKGVPAHLGYAKGSFINALRVAIEFDSMVPKEYPENTEGKEGYFVLHNLSGDICEVTMQYNIRDFAKENLIKREEILSKIAKILNKKYGNIIEIGFNHSYSNMYDAIKNEDLLISGTLKSISSLGIEPKVVPIRGGTDGAEITALGIPCPNLGAGGHNFHTIYEYVCLEDMISTSEILKSIVKTFSNETTRKRKP